MSQRPRTTQVNDGADATVDLPERTRARQIGGKEDRRKEKVANRQVVGTGAERPERRRSLRGGVHGEPARADLIALIVGYYAEMPGLSLHPHQAARLFGVREATCLAVLGALVRDERLRQSADGQYRAADSGV